MSPKSGLKTHISKNSWTTSPPVRFTFNQITIADHYDSDDDLISPGVGDAKDFHFDDIVTQSDCSIAKEDTAVFVKRSPSPTPIIDSENSEILQHYRRNSILSSSSCDD